MTDQLISTLIETGVLGVVVIACGWYIQKLSGRLNDVQDKRTADSQGVVKQILELTREQGQTAQMLGEALLENTNAVEGVASRLEALEKRVEALHHGPRNR